MNPDQHTHFCLQLLIREMVGFLKKPADLPKFCPSHGEHEQFHLSVRELMEALAKHKRVRKKWGETQVQRAGFRGIIHWHGARTEEGCKTGEGQEPEEEREIRTGGTGSWQQSEMFFCQMNLPVMQERGTGPTLRLFPTAR